MDSTNDIMIVEILNFFYPQHTVEEYQINIELRNLAAVMYAEALDASHAMDLVPRPSYTPSFNWLIKEGVQAFWRTQKGTDIYDTVRVTVALKYKTQYEMDKMGV